MRRAALLLVALAACGKARAEGALEDVKRDDLVIGVEVTGELAAVDSTDIKPPRLANVWDFKIASLAPEGADVKQGDPLVSFDVSNLSRDLDNVQNDAEEAKKKLAKKRDDAVLAKRDNELAVATAEADLAKKKLVADTPVDLVGSITQKTAQLDLEAAKLALDRTKRKAEQQARSDEAESHSLADHLTYAEHRVQDLQKNIANMQVAAPRPGTIVYPTDRWRQEKVKVGDSVWRELTIMQVVGLGSMFGKGHIDEVDSARVTEKQPISLRLDALPDVQVRGKVSKIQRAVHAKSQADPSKIVDLELALDPTTAPLRPGMRFRGQVEIERVEKAIIVPADAVFVTQGGPVAYVDHDGSLVETKLELGRRNATQIEVKSGLQPGDRVSRSQP